MLSEEEMSKVFAQFQTIRRTTADDFVRSRILCPDFKLPERVRYSQSMVFIAMADHFTSGLNSEINRFLVDLHHADCWVQVAEKYTRDDKLSLLWEFADPLLELAVTRPYALRNQFIFTAVHLLHQSNQLKIPSWQDDLPSDDRISYKQLERLGNDWKTFAPFLQEIQRLNSEDFKSKTRDFRHRLQHRFRFQFAIGLTAFMERKQTDAGVVYDYKIINPLNLTTLIPELYREHQIATDLFMAYWALIQELCGEWDSQHSHPKDSKAGDREINT